MGRKRSELTPAQEAKLRALMARGGTVETNTAALRAIGVDISPATVARRMRELKGAVNAERAERMRARAAPPPAPIPNPLKAPPLAKAGKRSAKKPKASEPPPPALPMPITPEGIPEATDPRTLDRWIETANRMGHQAESEGDLDNLAKMGRLVAALLEHRRKATPPEEPDPNEDPDMIAIAESVVKRLHDYVDKYDSLSRAGLA